MILALCFLFLLSACSKQTECVQPALDFRTRLLDAGGCSFESEIAASDGSEVTRFCLQCEYRTDGTADLTLTAPETLSGIRAHTERGGADLLFDEVQVAFPSLSDGRLAPMAAPCVLGDCWQSAYISLCGTEGDFLRVTYLSGFDGRELTVDCWFDGHGIPVHAEIACDGQTVLQAEITNFVFAS